MRPKFEQIPLLPHRSYFVHEPRVAQFRAPWHFHPEVELMLVLEGRGRRFVGDNIEPFGPGDLVLVGSNLPHFWHSEISFAPKARAHAIVVQFRPDFPGDAVRQVPELAAIHRLLARSRQGLVFTTSLAQKVEPDLRALPRLDGLEGLARLLAILACLTRGQTRPLASAHYSPHLPPRTGERLPRIFDFLTRNFRTSITLPQIARVAAMSPAAFSRYFKRTHGRNVSDVLIQLRIDHAARQLIETDQRITDLALESGFNTLSNFNRHFLAMKHMPPRAYRRLHRSAETEIAGIAGSEHERFLTTLPAPRPRA